MSKYFSISYFTFRDVMGSKVLYISTFLGVVIFLVTWISSTYTLGVPSKVAFDVGVGFIDISGFLMALIMGTTYLKAEIDSKSIYMTLSRPITREGFYLGKLFGLLMALLANISILVIAVLFNIVIFGGLSIQEVLLTVMMIFFKISLVLTLAQFFSLFIGKVLCAFTVFCLYLSGSMVGDKAIFSIVKSEVLKWFLEFYHFFLPGFYRFNIKNYYLYDLVLSSEEVLKTILYGGFYGLFVICLGLFIFKHMDFE